MKVLEELPVSGAHPEITHLCLGFFDGLHLGHAAVIRSALAHARRPEQVAVFTFKNHPSKVLHPQSAPKLLTAFPHKKRILESWGVQLVLAPVFDREKSQIQALDFLDLLHRMFPALEAIATGFNWKFGRGRQGNTLVLQEWATSQNIACQITQAVQENGEPISSTRIRAAVQEGALDLAASMLGRPFDLYGEVVRGRQVGRTIQFPTANLQTEDECLPPNGVYAGTAQLPDGTAHRCAVNIGTAPTVTGNEKVVRIEAHLLGFSGNLYEQPLSLALHKQIRPELRFPDLAALKAQISKDIQQIQSLA